MKEKPLNTKLINICAWCGKEQYGVFDESVSITHGICQDCLDSVNSEKSLQNLISHG